MGFQTAAIGILILVIVLAVFIPITQSLLPTMIGDMGGAVGLMISSLVVVIIASGMVVFMRQSMNKDTYEGSF